jgi:Methyltransferase FkbM domain
MPFITSLATARTITVPTNTLDYLLHDQPKSSLTLGAELLALKGSTSLLQQHRPLVWILEINDAVNNFGHQKQDLVNFLREHGYNLYTYSADTNKIFPITLNEQEGNNVLAIADSALDFVRDRLTGT